MMVLVVCIPATAGPVMDELTFTPKIPIERLKLDPQKCEDLSEEELALFEEVLASVYEEGVSRRAFYCYLHRERSPLHSVFLLISREYEWQAIEGGIKKSRSEAFQEALEKLKKEILPAPAITEPAHTERVFLLLKSRGYVRILSLL